MNMYFQMDLKMNQMVDFLIYSSVKTVGVNYPWLKNRVLLFLGKKPPNRPP